MTKLGFLDSGIGGLTVLEEFCAGQLKANSINKPAIEQIVYLADFANLPYGDKTTTELQTIFLNNLAWLESKVDLLVIACNTCSALLNEEITKHFLDLQIIDLISCTNSWLACKFQNLSKIAIFSTLATHSGGAYLNSLARVFPKAQVASVPCPELVPLIESHIDSVNFEIEIIDSVDFYAKQVPFLPEAIVLGCTHYPLLAKIFQKAFPNSVLINPAEALTDELKNYFYDQNTQFKAFTTAKPADFTAKLKNLKSHLSCVQYFPKQVQAAAITRAKLNLSELPIF